jgi:hypothetical protein
MSKPTCPVCGDGRKAREAICDRCRANPGAARALLERERRTALAEQHRAATEAQAAYDALTEAERKRWGRLCELRARKDNGDANLAEIGLVERSWQALMDASDDRYPASIRRAAHADEHLWWITEGLATTQRRIDVRLATLKVALEEVTK